MGGMERAYLCSISDPYVGVCRKHVLQSSFGLGAHFVAKVLALLQNAWLVRIVVFMCTPLHVMRTSVSLCTLTPSMVNTEMVPVSDVWPTLMSEWGKSLNVSASVILGSRCGMGNVVTLEPRLTLQLATHTRFLERRKMGRPAVFRSHLLM